LGKALAAGNQSVIETALDLGIVTDQLMGTGELERMSDEERNQMLAVFRRTQLEIIFEYKQTSADNKFRFVHLDEKDDRAEALYLSPLDDFLKLHLINRKGTWYLVEIVQADTGLHVIAESLAPVITAIRQARSGHKQVVARSEFVRTLVLSGTKPEKAIEIADQALKADPSNQGLRFAKATALINAKRKEEGQKLLNELTNEQPAYLPAVYKLASFFDFSKNADDQKQGAELYRRYITMEPNDPRGHKMIAMIYEQDNDLTQAKIEYRKAIECDPDNWSGYYDLVYFLVDHDRISELSGVFESSDQHPDAGADIFGSIIESLYFDEEGELAEKLATSQPARMKTSFLGNLNLARYFVENGSPIKALPLLSTATQLDKKSAEPYVTMVNAYRGLARWTSGLRAADKAIELEPKNGEAHYERACVLTRLGRTSEAIRELTTSIEIQPGRAFSVAHEKDLKGLSSLPAYKKILEDLEKKKAADAEPK
jgi:tetratricopeptide (TPR) repeat protein